MVIIIRNTGTIEEAVMTYTTSEWMDAQTMMHGGGIGYTVADTVINSHNVLGVSSETLDVMGEVVVEIPAMTHSQVVAVSIGDSFSIPS